MRFFNSLTGQLGRDAGKVVSNAVWGDKHASVYRKAPSRNNYDDTYSQEDTEQYKISKAETTVECGVVKVLAMKIPQQKEKMVELLQELTIMLTANPWGSVLKEKHKITNKYSDAIFVKYEQVLYSLKAKYPQSSECVYFSLQFEKMAKTRKRKKYLEILLVSVLIAAIIIGMLIADKYR